MTSEEAGRGPGPTPATSAITLAVGDPLAPEELEEFDHYLTARWQLYTTLGPVLARSNVEHEPWPLHRAVVRELDGNLVAAAGLPAPHGEPVVHWSPGGPDQDQRPAPAPASLTAERFGCRS